MTDHIRLSQKAKEQLVRLKRHTGLKNWNVLCRWALCVSLAEESRPARVQIAADSNVEMTWQVFAGEYGDLYQALLIQRCIDDNVEPTEEAVAEEFRLHLHRGIGYLAADQGLRSIGGLVSKALPSPPAASA